MRGQLPQPATGERATPAVADAELVARARIDRAAFAPLYDRYADAVIRFCYYRIGDRLEAEDAAGDVFANVLASLDRYRDDAREEGFRCYLFTIARNVVAKRLRDRRVEQRLEVAAFVADRAPSPEESALAADDHRFVRSLLDRLRPQQRELLELRLAGLNDAEIARVLERSHDAVRKEQSRAIQKLRAMLVDESGQGGDE